MNKVIYQARVCHPRAGGDPVYKKSTASLLSFIYCRIPAFAGMTTVLLAICALSGCVAVWGAPYKVEFKSSSSITFSYDPMMANWGEVQNIAQAHCDQYGKDAVPGRETGSPWGLNTRAFDCKKRGK